VKVRTRDLGETVDSSGALDSTKEIVSGTGIAYFDGFGQVGSET